MTIISIFSLPKRQIKNVITTTDNSNDKFFKIDQETGYLSLLKKLNIRHKYLLKIQVTDNFGLTAETKIEASVEDVNDHAPVFAKVINHFHEIFIHADFNLTIFLISSQKTRLITNLESVKEHMIM